ncbi:hypothetical protein [Alphaproteobacteria bacterium endosymbiont of Tiliacea citrago]|uniref:hypothetical protein n=1 Tax=Alphaproteobacteria bacterium endosymbiont of Tiliacea citrago TaxID=3077944 RepID=UPI00313ED4DF
MNKVNELQKIIRNLQKIYNYAIQSENLAIALQSQKVLASIINHKKEEVSLANLNKDQIEKLIKESESKLHK